MPGWQPRRRADDRRRKPEDQPYELCCPVSAAARMRARLFCAVAILAVMLTPAAVAQQGHPLVGVWSGDWGPTQSERHQIVMELKWKDTTLSGTINPGEKDETVIKVGKLDSSNWTVHLEGDSKDAARIVVD